jgi:hypothetical protein
MSKRTAATSVASRASMFACALGLSFSLLGIPAASAITWNFNTPDAPALPNTTLGTTQTYTAGGSTITAAGFSASTLQVDLTRNITGGPLNLYSKLDTGNPTGSENGVGLAADLDHEIVAPNHLVRVALPTGLTGLSFKMGSTTDGEGWQVYGSQLALTGYSLLTSGFDESTHLLAGVFNYLFFRTTGESGESNTLLAQISGTVAAVPLPPALLLFGTALAGLGILGRRRKKQHPAQAV